MGFRLTTRDIRLLQWINRFGFVTVHHIQSWMGVGQTTAYVRCRKLVQAGYLLHDSIFAGQQGIYRLTQSGQYVSGSALPVVKNITLGQYYHDLNVVSLSLCLCQRYDAQFITERELRQENHSSFLGRVGHRSDGVLIMDTQKIAIEVELSKKGKYRWDGIMKHYLKNFDITDLWYFCGDQLIQRRLQSYQKVLPHLKVNCLSDFIEPLLPMAIKSVKTPVSPTASLNTLKG